MHIITVEVEIFWNLEFLKNHKVTTTCGMMCQCERSIGCQRSVAANYLLGESQLQSQVQLHIKDSAEILLTVRLVPGSQRFKSIDIKLKNPLKGCRYV